MDTTGRSSMYSFINVAQETCVPFLGLPLRTRVRPDSSRKTVVIIGGGYTGLSAALHLSANKKLRVIVLDAGRIGGGPSGKSAGHVCVLEKGDQETIAYCGQKLGQQLVKASQDGMTLVRDLVRDHTIGCDLRDGYMTVKKDGTQIIERGEQFGLAPYPYILGLARAAQKAGVKLYENTPVTGLYDNGPFNIFITAWGPTIEADYVVATGGHRMMEKISFLRPLRAKTTELRISMIASDPLPLEVLQTVMPENAITRYPFANEAVDVAYGSLTHDNCLVFGTDAHALYDPSPEAIRKTLFQMFPTLEETYWKKTGKELVTRACVSAEKINYTSSRLPLVGRMGEMGNILYAAGLGGHGIALGTVLGKAAADKILQLNDPMLSQRELVFDQFAAVTHHWLPAPEPFRSLIAEAGLLYYKAAGAATAVKDKIKQALTPHP